MRLEQVHGSAVVARGAKRIREALAGYIELKPHMDVIVHHTTVSGEFALCRLQWRITGTDQHGEPIEVHHHGMEVMRRLPNGEWVFFIDHPVGGGRLLGRGPAASHHLMRTLPKPPDPNFACRKQLFCERLSPSRIAPARLRWRILPCASSLK